MLLVFTSPSSFVEGNDRGNNIRGRADEANIIEEFGRPMKTMTERRRGLGSTNAGKIKTTVKDKDKGVKKVTKKEGDTKMDKAKFTKDGHPPKIDKEGGKFEKGMNNNKEGKRGKFDKEVANKEGKPWAKEKFGKGFQKTTATATATAAAAEVDQYNLVLVENPFDEHSFPENYADYDAFVAAVHANAP